MATALYAAPLGVPRFKSFLPTTGLPNVGGKVSIFQAGTSNADTSYPTYADALLGSNPNANPVILDSAGEATIFLQAGRLYKIVVADSTGATLSDGTIDNINPATGYPGATTGTQFLGEWIVETNTVTRVSATQFKVLGVDVTTLYHLGRRIRCLVSSQTGTVQSSSFSTDTTVTVAMDPGMQVSSPLTQVAYGLLSYGAPFASSYLDPRTGFCVTKNTNMTGFAALTKVIGWSVETDPLSEWDNANNRWTAKFGGTYAISCAAEVSDTGANQSVLLELDNAAPSKFASSQNYTHATAGNHTTLTCSRVVALAAGASVQMMLTGTANTTVYGNNPTMISIQRIP